MDFAQARSDTSTADALTDINAATDDWRSAGQAQQVLINSQPQKATANSYLTLAQYLYLAGDTRAGDQAVAQAKQQQGANPQTIDQQMKSIQQLGQQLQAAIKQLTKQQQQQQASGATGGAGGGATSGGAAPGGNPLNSLGTGGL